MKQRPNLFIQREIPTTWGSPRERERRRRIMVAVAAYAYEIMNDPIWSDRKYDSRCRHINLRRSTGNKEMDQWWKDNFSIFTGMWIWKHPHKKGLARIYKMIKRLEK